MVQGGSAGGGAGRGRGSHRVRGRGGQGVGEEGKSPRRIIGKRVLRIYSSTPLDQNLYPAIPLQYPCKAPCNTSHVLHRQHIVVKALRFLDK